MKIRQQIGFFADFTSIQATPERTVELFKSLSSVDASLLPSTAQEFDPVSMKGIPRLKFSNPSGTLEVLISGRRIDVSNRQPFGHSSDLIDSVQFSVVAQDAIAAVLQATGQKGARLTWIETHALQEMSPEVLESAYDRLFKSPSFFADKTLIDWTFKVNARYGLNFSGAAEDINAILKIERAQGQALLNGAWVAFDRLFYEADINTLAQNQSARFGAGAVSDFASGAADLSKALFADADSLLFSN